MTDKNFETADFTSSEKQARLRTVFFSDWDIYIDTIYLLQLPTQVRFSMTTIRTPPNSPKPPSARPDLRPKMATSKVKQVYSVTCLL